MSSPEHTLAAARAHHQARRLEDAKAHYLKILATDPEHAGALHGLGLLASQVDRDDAAMELIGRSLKQAPDNADALNDLATVLQRQGRPVEALAQLDRAIALRTDFAEAHNLRGLILAELGVVEAALASLERAVTLDPELGTAHFNLGNVRGQQGDWEGAVTAYGRAADLLPALAAVSYNLGGALQRLQRPEAAEAAFARAIALDPGYAEAHANRGVILSDLDRFEEAAESYAQALALRPDLIRPRFNLALAERRLGRLEAAAANLDRVLAQMPDHREAHHILGAVLNDLIRLGRADAAQAAATRWFAGHPGSPVARHIGAAILGRPAPERSSDAYLRELFDRFSVEFDDKLAQLDYQAPQLLAAAVADEIGNTADLRVLDAGCGTGLCAAWLRPLARQLDGVDISPGMLSKAASRQLYNQLHEVEVADFLEQTPGSFDLIVAGDVLCYFGALNRIIAAAARALAPGGLFAFSVEQAEHGPWMLQPTGRYAHDEDHVRAAVTAAGLALAGFGAGVLRVETGKQVAGFIVTARRPANGPPPGLDA